LGHNVEDNCVDDDDDGDDDDDDDDDISFRVTATYHKNLNVRVANDSLRFVKMVVLHKIITLNALHFLRYS
jgi:hypothetical protein